MRSRKWKDGMKDEDMRLYDTRHDSIIVGMSETAKQLRSSEDDSNVEGVERIEAKAYIQRHRVGFLARHHREQRYQPAVSEWTE